VSFTPPLCSGRVQGQGDPLKLHPCAFYSKKLSPAEQNYHIGNQELLAIKLALEEWSNWLEGANHHFEVNQSSQPGIPQRRERAESPSGLMGSLLYLL